MKHKKIVLLILVMLLIGGGSIILVLNYKQTQKNDFDIINVEQEAIDISHMGDYVQNYTHMPSFDAEVIETPIEEIKEDVEDAFDAWDIDVQNLQKMLNCLLTK